MKSELRAVEQLPPTNSSALSPSRGRWKAIFGALAAGILLAVFSGAIAVAWMNAGLSKAQRLAKQDRWEEASVAVSNYLWLWPRDSEARLLAAESIYRAEDDARRTEAAARKALHQLQWIPDDSRHGPEARLRAAGLLFTILKSPHAAEIQLRRAIDSSPDRIQSHLLLWKILDATGRSDFAEPTVREVIRLSPPDKKIIHIRSWYLSQFAPAAANLELDLLLGVVAANELPTVATEEARYELFRAAEPESPTHTAGAARLLLLRKNQARRAADMLTEFYHEFRPVDTFFAAVWAESAYAAGDMAMFQEAMRHWPEPHGGYDYDKWEGIRLEEVEDDPAAAAASYERALRVWPGSVDWQVAFRLANCLRRLGKIEEAARLKAHSDEIGKLIGDDFHRPLRDALADLADPVAAEQAAELYEKIDRPWEMGLWQEHAVLLRQ